MSMRPSGILGYGVELPEEFDDDKVCDLETEFPGLEVAYSGDLNWDSNYLYLLVDNSTIQEGVVDPSTMKVLPAWNDLLKKACEKYGIKFKPSWWLIASYG